jgi:Trypsin
LALLFALALCGMSGAAHAIMRRHDVPDSEYVVDAEDFPAVVDLLEPGDCLATLVAPSFVVTAAHCAEDVVRPHRIHVDGEPREVLGVICAEGYDGDIDDVALVHIDPPVTGVAPIAIYRQDDELGQLVTFIGRGDSGTGLEGQRAARRDLETRRATNVVSGVSSHWIEFVFESPADPAVTDLEGISGDGDSGGPALVESPDGPLLVGISSWQDGPERKIGRYGAREFYTRVSRHTAFIDGTTGPDWNRKYRACDAGRGCSLAPATGRRSGLPAQLLACAVALALLRRRR